MSREESYLSTITQLTWSWLLRDPSVFSPLMWLCSLLGNLHGPGRMHHSWCNSMEGGMREICVWTEHGLLVLATSRNGMM